MVQYSTKSRKLLWLWLHCAYSWVLCNAAIFIAYLLSPGSGRCDAPKCVSEMDKKKVTTWHDLTAQCDPSKDVLQIHHSAALTEAPRSYHGGYVTAVSLPKQLDELLSRSNSHFTLVSAAPNLPPGHQFGHALHDDRSSVFTHIWLRWRSCHTASYCHFSVLKVVTPAQQSLLFEFSHCHLPHADSSVLVVSLFFKLSW